MRAALLWTINDFLAQSSLSGWSEQAYKAYLTCNEDTPPLCVKGQNVYFGHRRSLPMTRPMRQSRKFNGKVEKRPPPRRWTTKDILRQMSLLPVTLLGKHMSFGGQKQIVNQLKTFNWRKKRIFFELEYWSLVLRYILDVMHIEKNVCDSLLNTSWGWISPKTQIMLEKI